MKTLALFFLLAFMLASQVGPTTIADLTGDGSAHQVSVSAIQARVADITALPANTGNCRLGDSNITTSRGQVIAAGGSYHYELPENRNYSGTQQTFDLSKIYWLCGSGDKLAVHYVQ